MKKRIVISVTNDLSSDQRVSRVCRTLHDHGYEVLLVGRKRKASIPLKGKPYREKRLKLLVETGPLFYLFFNIRLFFYLLTRKADIFLANDMDVLLANTLAAKLKGKGLLYDSHEYWTEIPELIARPRVRKVWYWLERRLFPKVDRAATVNESIALIYQEKYGKQVHSIRNLPFRKPEPPVREQSGRIIIYQGALNVGRGLELMIEAMPHLPGYELRILGYGPIQDELHAMPEALGVKEQVKFYGLIPFEELHPITREAALGLSIEEDRGASYHFALPNKLFDYVQAGVPVLVSDLPEMRRVVEENEVGEVLELVERNPERLAERIRGMVEGEHWQQYHQSAIKAGKELCWENERAELLRFVEGE